VEAFCARRRCLTIGVDLEGFAKKLANHSPHGVSKAAIVWFFLKILQAQAQL